MLRINFRANPHGRRQNAHVACTTRRSSAAAIRPGAARLARRCTTNDLWRAICALVCSSCAEKTGSLKRASAPKMSAMSSAVRSSMDPKALRDPVEFAPVPPAMLFALCRSSKCFFLISSDSSVTWHRASHSAFLRSATSTRLASASCSTPRSLPSSAAFSAPSCLLRSLLAASPSAALASRLSSLRLCSLSPLISACCVSN
mmetsp:Transcript_17537/g.44478  ORF Transcript_17537/g.44478 Transcript_17537/m.44478 type:complete len:202 (-) Transcript_17537:411-1016(-)